MTTSAEIVYRDGSVIVVDKPAGLVVHPAPGHHGETLVDLLRGMAGGGPGERPGIVHRLDRDTSGPLVVAASEAAHRELARQVQEREMGRDYLALVEVSLETGRTHQIRTHFEAIGHPVCGDPRYGQASRHGLQRQFLHARRLSFRHPDSGKTISFSSELPPDLTQALERARDG